MVFRSLACDYHQFWMLDMHFPLDFIWIKENTVVDITENVRPPDNASSLPPIFSSKIPFDKALEIKNQKDMEKLLEGGSERKISKSY